MIKKILHTMLKKRIKLNSFATFFKEYYNTLTLEFPDKIVSNELEAVGDKALYEEWLNIISGKKLKSATVNQLKAKELQMLADKMQKSFLIMQNYPR